MIKKLNKLFKAIRNIIKYPSLVNLLINNDIVWSNYLQKKYPKNSRLPLVDIIQLVPEISQTSINFSFLGGGSMPTDIILLKSLAASIENCRFFEIGTWRGETVLNIAESAKECYTLNLSKDEIIEMGLSRKYAELHGFFSKNIDNITHLYGNSLYFDFSSLEQKFDLIFIDGNHKYEYVKNDTEKVFRHLVHENSIVVWHDYAYDPENPRPEVLAGILDGIPNKNTEKLYHVSQTKCAIYSSKTLKIENVIFPQKPDKIFRLKLDIKPI